jgi:hypothetical protein
MTMTTTKLVAVVAMAALLLGTFVFQAAAQESQSAKTFESASIKLVLTKWTSRILLALRDCGSPLWPMYMPPYNIVSYY